MREDLSIADRDLILDPVHILIFVNYLSLYSIYNTCMFNIE